MGEIHHIVGILGDYSNNQKKTGTWQGKNLRKLLRRDLFPVKTTHNVVIHGISIFYMPFNAKCSFNLMIMGVIQKDCNLSGKLLQ